MNRPLFSHGCETYGLSAVVYQDLALRATYPYRGVVLTRATKIWHFAPPVPNGALFGYFSLALFLTHQPWWVDSFPIECRKLML